MVVNSNFILFFDVVNQHSTILFNFEPLSNLKSVLKKDQNSDDIMLIWQDEHLKVYKYNQIGWTSLNYMGE